MNRRVKFSYRDLTNLLQHVHNVIKQKSGPWRSTSKRNCKRIPLQNIKVLASECSPIGSLGCLHSIVVLISMENGRNLIDIPALHCIYVLSCFL